MAIRRAYGIRETTIVKDDHQPFKPSWLGSARYNHLIPCCTKRERSQRPGCTCGKIGREKKESASDHYGNGFMPLIDDDLWHHQCLPIASIVVAAV
jgi:hypothetical protein